jgi:hypothetical protein
LLSVWRLTRHGFLSAFSASIAAISSMRLLVVRASPPDSSRSLPPERRIAPQPPGPGLPLHAPSVKISTSAAARHQATSSRGSLKVMRSGCARPFLGDLEALGERVDHFADQHFGRRGAGGEADRAGVPSQSQSMSLARWISRAGDAEPLGDFGEAQRIAAVGRADHQHPVALRAIALTAAWRLEVA